MTTTTSTATAAPEKKGGESLLTVLIALGANTIIAIAKTIAAVFTGSASMVAEAAHSWSDAGNEIFLLIAERRGAKEADESHPLGYGKEAYVWSMFAAFGLFTVGAVVSIMHGVQSWNAVEEEADYTWAYVILGLAFLLEGVSFLQATRQARKEAEAIGTTTLGYINRTSNPTLRAVFAEDLAALIGLAIAAAALLAHQLTADPRWDALGSILVGVLLGIVAVFLIGKNRAFLTGQAVNDDTRRRALAQILAHPEIERVTYLHLEYVGADRIYLVAAVDLAGNNTEDTVADVLDRLERQIERHELIQRCILSLSRRDEPALTLE